MCWPDLTGNAVQVQIFPWFLFETDKSWVESYVTKNSIPFKVIRVTEKDSFSCLFFKLNLFNYVMFLLIKDLLLVTFSWFFTSYEAMSHHIAQSTRKPQIFKPDHPSLTLAQPLLSRFYHCNYTSASNQVLISNQVFISNKLSLCANWNANFT